MLFPTAWLALSILVLQVTANAGTPTVKHIRRKDLTNAERMQRGLPPNPPKRRYDPTRVRRQGQASQTPTQLVITRSYPVNKRQAATQYLMYDTDLINFFFTTVAEDAAVFNVPGTGPLTDMEVTVGKGEYLALLGEGYETTSYGWSNNLTSIATSDNGKPLGKDYQTSVFGIDGIGSEVTSSYQVDSTTSLSTYYFLGRDGEIITAHDSEAVLGGAATNVFLQWTVIPVPDPQPEP